MQHPIADLLGTSLIPELSSDVAAGTACDKELVLVAVAAVRALPHQLASLILNNLDLAVIATLLTEIPHRSGGEAICTESYAASE